MATIVRHNDTGSEFILLGTGFGAYKSSKPHWFFGDWIADEKSGELAMVAVCNRDGEIGWFNSSDLIVISVDGQVPTSLI